VAADQEEESAATIEVTAVKADIGSVSMLRDKSTKVNGSHHLS